MGCSGWLSAAGTGTEAPPMARTRYATDRGLIARMGATMFLLGLVFVAFIAALVYLLGAFSNIGSAGIVFIAALFGIGTAFVSYFWSDKIALRTSGAREVSPQQAPELHGVIDRLCALADMPKAFATGRSSKVAVVCVTEGLLRRLDRDELEGVIAHEMSHVAHKDVAVMTLASFLGIVAALVVRFAFYSELFGGGGRSNNNNGNNQGALPVILAVMVVGMVVYAISFLLIRLLSGQPSALASALQKVTGDMARIPTRDLRAAEPLNAFYFAPAFAKGRGQVTLSSLFSTHPSLERRLAELAKISKQLSR